jgi:chitosanase
VTFSHRFYLHDTRMSRSVILAVVCCLVAACCSARAASAVTPQQHDTIDQLTSIFENSTPVLQYAYCENIGDGRGYTAGRAGFTTATHDLLQVVMEYTSQNATNILASLLPALKKVDGTNSTQGLDTLCDLWADASNNDAEFRHVQDDVSNQLYWDPSVEHSSKLGLVLPLSRGQMYDAIIQHGDGDDPDGLPEMIKETVAEMGGSPKTGVNEEAWLRAFFNVRVQHLLNASDPSTEHSWSVLAIGSLTRTEVVSRVLLVDLQCGSCLLLRPHRELEQLAAGAPVQYHRLRRPLRTCQRHLHPAERRGQRVRDGALTEEESRSYHRPASSRHGRTDTMSCTRRGPHAYARARDSAGGSHRSRLSVRRFSDAAREGQHYAERRGPARHAGDRSGSRSIESADAMQSLSV